MSPWVAAARRRGLLSAEPSDSQNLPTRSSGHAGSRVLQAVRGPTEVTRHLQAGRPSPPSHSIPSSYQQKRSRRKISRVERAAPPGPGVHHVSSDVCSAELSLLPPAESRRLRERPLILPRPCERRPPPDPPHNTVSDVPLHLGTFNLRWERVSKKKKKKKEMKKMGCAKCASVVLNN